MNKRLLRWVTIIIPVGFLVSFITLMDFVFDEVISFVEIVVVLVIAILGAAWFSNWVFGFIDRRELEIGRRVNQLEALNQATLLLSTELDLKSVLQNVVQLSCDLVQARYGALGVLNVEGDKFSQFIFSGLSEDLKESIGDFPHGDGLFGLLLHDGESLVVSEIDSHPRAIGFPASHPPMKTLVGVPIKLKGDVIGNLYLADKRGKREEDGPIPFTEEDKFILEMFSNQAAIAIENARLYRQEAQLAILEERQRFGMDLHDGIIQSLYGVGLNLEDIRHKVLDDPQTAQTRIKDVSQGINTVITDIRNYILDLQPSNFQGRDVVEGVRELARALRANTFMNVMVEIDDALQPDWLSSDQTLDILHIAQEALSNVQKHARASDVRISLNCDGKYLELTIEDNGVSISPEALQSPSGNGLKNMQDRAMGLSGKFEVVAGESGGSQVYLKIPVGS